MRKVNFKLWILPEYEVNESTKRTTLKPGTRCFEDKYSQSGIFHAWGTDYEECDANFGNYTVAIIELPDGTVTKVLPQNIQFLDAEPACIPQ